MRSWGWEFSEGNMVGRGNGWTEPKDWRGEWEGTLRIKSWEISRKSKQLSSEYKAWRDEPEAGYSQRMKAWSEKKVKRQAWSRPWRTTLRKWGLSVFKSWKFISKKMVLSVCRLCLCIEGLVKSGGATCPRCESRTSGLPMSHTASILPLTESRQTGSIAHWPMRNQSCHIMSLRRWRSSGCWRNQALIGTKSPCVCRPHFGVRNGSMGSEQTWRWYASLSHRPQLCRSLLL